MNPALSIIADCQRILAAHLPPDGISERACISALLGVLDNPEAVAMTFNLAASNAPDMASPDVRAALESRASHNQKAYAESLKAHAASCAQSAILGIAPPPPPPVPPQHLLDEREELKAKLLDVMAQAAQLAGRAARLEDELNRKRQAENDLIRDRDRLIHGDIAKLHQQVKELTVELDDSRGAVSRFAQRNAQAEAELIAASDRERVLSERLANIASISAAH